MKKRLIKKWVNRYLVPVLAGLPETTSFATEIRVGETKIMTCKNQHKTVNGHPKREGERSFPEKITFRTFKRTGEFAQAVRYQHRIVFLRKIELSYGRLYLRMITE